MSPGHARRANLIRQMRMHWPLLVAVGLGLALRLALWDQLPRSGLIGDEAEYLASADWLAHGRGFAWHRDYFWTRAPLYPLFLAAHIALFGRRMEPIFVTQIMLSLLQIGLVYSLAWHSMRHLTAVRRTGAGIAAGFTAIYLPPAAYPQLLLSETLFLTLLLSALLVLAHATHAGNHPSHTTPITHSHWWQPKLGRAGPYLIAGVLLGLASLTRGLTLGFLPLVAIWAWWSNQRHLAAPLLLVGAAILTIAPWSLYASRNYGGPIVIDTTGSFNLALGARTAYDGGRSDAPTRNFLLALLDPQLDNDQRHALLADERNGACLYAVDDPRLLAALEQPARTISQAQRQQLLSAEAFCLLQARPLAFINKSLVEFIDLFQINYTGAERLSQGFALGWLPRWYTLALFLLDDTLYVLSLPLAVLGWILLRRDPIHRPTTALITLIGIWLGYNLATAPLLFAINRFRVPLMPFVFILASVAIVQLAQLRTLGRDRYGRAGAILALLLALIAATPYAYLEPHAPGEASRLASYLGPYPSALSATRLAWQTRPAYESEQRLAHALGTGDTQAIHAALSDPYLPDYARAVGEPLFAGSRGNPETGLELLANQTIEPLADWQRSVVAGELLRRMGRIEDARREFNPTLVDDQNPVAWTWAWFDPPRLPNDRLEIADDNDLGYLNGFYLGRYDPDLQATTRWAGPESFLRFPQAATGQPRTLCLNISGLGWPTDLALPVVHVAAGEHSIGHITLDRTLRTACLGLPPQPAGSDYLIALRSDAFVPDALDLIAQQGPQVGQLRLLAFQLDWGEVR
jgi:4-amino-4-deoxy-L-arabinose transferase-like glycosyltransferase